MAKTIQVTLRDRTFTGVVTTADLVPVSNLLMNAEERGIMNNPLNPDPIAASDLMTARLTAQLEELTEEYGGGEEAADRANETIMNGWIRRLMVICESDLALRTLVITRLIEIFPEIPREWMWYDRDSGLAGHRLEFDELLLDLVIPVYTAVAQEEDAEMQARMKRRDAKAALSTIAKDAAPAPATKPAQSEWIQPYSGKMYQEQHTTAPAPSTATATPSISPEAIKSMSPQDRMALLEALKTPENNDSLLAEISQKQKV